MIFYDPIYQIVAFAYSARPCNYIRPWNTGEWWDAVILVSRCIASFYWSQSCCTSQPVDGFLWNICADRVWKPNPSTRYLVV